MTLPPWASLVALVVGLQPPRRALRGSELGRDALPVRAPLRRRGFVWVFFTPRVRPHRPFIIVPLDIIHMGLWGSIPDVGSIPSVKYA